MDNQDYKRVHDLFTLAEQRVKLIEQLDYEIVIPALNQLRYVGQHVLEALFLEEGAERTRHIQEAETHASRVAYDALEAGTLDLLMEFEQFKKRLPHDNNRRHHTGLLRYVRSCR